MRQALTLLQRAVVQRLREGGYAALADVAYEAWSQDERLPLSQSPANAPQSLITDFGRANGHAGGGTPKD